MGRYASIYLENIKLGSTKNDFDPAILQFLRSEDKNIVTDLKQEIPKVLEFYRDEYLEESNTPFLIFYKTPVSILKDRLELFGYTFETCKLAFEEFIKNHIKFIDSNSIDYPENKEYNESEKEFYQKLSFENWIQKIKEINNSPDERENLDRPWNSPWFGYMGSDLNVIIRLVIETISNETYLIYDFTDLAEGDYIDPEDDFVEDSSQEIYTNIAKVSKIIVLTEGKNDSIILRGTIDILYPHMSSYFTFLNFEQNKIAGGVGYLATTVKSFAGAGIINKIIALFDNDTAAKSAITSLKKIALPINIKVTQLPDNNILKNYPTLGPSGLVNMDVNGLAGSIDTYLGKQNLVDTSGNYFPIQWTGYDQGAKAYQGEILSKDTIISNFEKQLSICKNDPSRISDYDWSELRLVCKHLFSLFNSNDRKKIISDAQQLSYY